MTLDSRIDRVSTTSDDLFGVLGILILCSETAVVVVLSVLSGSTRAAMTRSSLSGSISWNGSSISINTRPQSQGSVHPPEAHKDRSNQSRAIATEDSTKNRKVIMISNERSDTDTQIVFKTLHQAYATNPCTNV